ncbi:MAG TPA: hypothetical protein VIP11_26940 [Gemmatimonadaceae bacterium]
MRRVYARSLPLAAIMFAAAASSVLAQDANRKVEGGGITVQGWAGKIDPNEEGKGEKLENSKLAKMGNDFHVTTGPATTYWNPANKATGDYTVKAKFTEPKYMNLNNHPHPYGIMIGGNDLGTGEQSFLYCTTYGDGTYIMRGFSGSTPFQLGGRRPTANEAVNKAAGKDQPVTQEIAISVKGDQVSCAVNGKTVVSYPKSEVVGAGKLKSTDGIWGIRFAHNTEAMVSGLTMTKP